MSIVSRCLIAAVLLFCLTAHSIACPPPRVGSTIYVGDTRKFIGDPNCQAGDINTAINQIVCPETTIVVTREIDYTSQHITPNGKSFTLKAAGYDIGCGGVQRCDPFTGCHDPGAIAPPLVLEGANGANIMTITGDSHIAINGFNFFGGHPIDNANHNATGGGIYFDGTGELAVTNSIVSSNIADYGGGIAVRGGSAGAILRIDSATQIIFNTANTSGGGIRLEGNARMIAVGDDILIGENTATPGYGGGVEILGPARADIGASGHLSGGVLDGNGAANGGGVAVINNGNGTPVLRVFARDSDHPSVIANNSASVNGGAIYMDGQANTCLYAPHINNNQAADGAAIYKKQPYGDGGLYINDAPDSLGTQCGPETISALGGAISCNYAAHCNTFTDNNTGGAADSAVINQQFGEFTAQRFSLQSSSAVYAIRTQDTIINVSRCLITDNQTASSVVVSDYWDVGTSVSYKSCTIANNTIGGNAPVFRFLEQRFVDISDSIIYQPGLKSVHFTPYIGGDVITASYIMTNDTTTLPGNNPSIVIDDPRFADVTSGDYHLRNDSPALDFAPDESDQSLDCYFGTFDLVSVANRFGASDLGAYELLSTDRIFASGMGDPMKPISCP